MVASQGKGHSDPTATGARWVPTWGTSAGQSQTSVGLCTVKLCQEAPPALSVPRLQVRAVIAMGTPAGGDETEGRARENKVRHLSQELLLEQEASTQWEAASHPLEHLPHLWHLQRPYRRYHLHPHPPSTTCISCTTRITQSPCASCTTCVTCVATPLARPAASQHLPCLPLLPGKGGDGTKRRQVREVAGLKL